MHRLDDELSSLGYGKKEDVIPVNLTEVRMEDYILLLRKEKINENQGSGKIRYWL